MSVFSLILFIWQWICALFFQLFCSSFVHMSLNLLVIDLFFNSVQVLVLWSFETSKTIFLFLEKNCRTHESRFRENKKGLDQLQRLVETKFRQSGVPTWDWFSRRILKVCVLGQVEARYWNPKIVFRQRTNTRTVRTCSNITVHTCESIDGCNSFMN